ncbi:hypothetical protein BpHYR1_043474 [Brachionus plicatilis]|uniref:Uncharacterized protein n=1 Tax=Brachionus plicatilis TaxID=10195 RepID=A0A3M7QL27_BRAPC|nr:hypothetical protein BpHYR1_043474 [Brachionus plicatilis]
MCNMSSSSRQIKEKTVLSIQLFSVGLDGSFKTHRSSYASIISSRTRPLASEDLHPTTGVLALRSPKKTRSSPNSHVRRNI